MTTIVYNLKDIPLDSLTNLMSQKEIEEVNFLDLAPKFFEKEYNDYFNEVFLKTNQKTIVYNLPILRNDNLFVEDILRLWYAATNTEPSSHTYFDRSKDVDINGMVGSFQQFFLGGHSQYQAEKMELHLLVKKVHDGMDYNLYRFMLVDPVRTDNRQYFYVLICPVTKLTKI